MLPASDLTEILANLAALNLQPNTAAAVLGAVLAPLMRAGPSPIDSNIAVEHPSPKRAARPRLRPRKKPAAARPKRRAVRSMEARQRARAAIAANPDASPNELAKAASCSRGTVTLARRDLAAEARKQARKQARDTSTAKPLTEHRSRAQRFLRDMLAGGPKPVSEVEAAAAKAHIDEALLGQARGDLHIVTTRGNAGGVQAVQWSLPG